MGIPATVTRYFLTKGWAASSVRPELNLAGRTIRRITGFDAAAVRPYGAGYFSGKDACFGKYGGVWDPKLALPAAKAMTDYAGVQKGSDVLDYGFGHGFYLRAMHELLGMPNAFGCDLSEFAVENVHPTLKPFVRQCSYSDPVPFDKVFDLIIAKDVLEHVDYDKLPGLLQQMRAKTKKLFMVVPMADGGKYRIPEYEKDKTHIVRENETWWIGLIQNAGFGIISTSHRMNGLKDGWHRECQTGDYIMLAE